ncbi:MAG TPA: branched-chain amino acid ABC transporter permease [Candidatus Dormibacteraeota bacterium]|nr:branched-chain amino acid ABC transporter permease [Candidatus Dormibacteraeota bacterium]
MVNARRRALGEAVALALLGLGVAFIGRMFLSDYWLTVGIVIAMYSLPSLALLLLLGYAGRPSFGHAAFFAVGAYASAVTTTRLGWHPLVGMLVGIAIAGIVAYAIGFPLLRLSGHYLAIATLAFAIIVRVVLENATPITGGLNGIVGIPGLGTPRSAFFVVVILVTIIYTAAVVIDHSRVGRILRALGDDERAMASCGINPQAIRTAVFVASACLTSIAGSVYAHFLSYISPEPFNVDMSVLFVTMMLVGGTGSVWGALIGACVVGVVPAVLSVYASYSALLYGVAIVAVLLFMPQGFLGVPRQIHVAVSRLRRSPSSGREGVRGSETAHVE